MFIDLMQWEWNPNSLYFMSCSFCSSLEIMIHCCVSLQNIHQTSNPKEELKNETLVFWSFGKTYTCILTCTYVYTTRLHHQPFFIFSDKKNELYLDYQGWTNNNMKTTTSNQPRATTTRKSKQQHRRGKIGRDNSSHLLNIRNQ